MVHQHQRQNSGWPQFWDIKCCHDCHSKSGMEETLHEKKSKYFYQWLLFKYLNNYEFSWDSASLNIAFITLWPKPMLIFIFLFFIFLFSLSSYIFLSIAWHSHLISVLWLLFPGLMITYSKFCACLAVNCWDLSHSFLAVSKVFLNERKGTPGIFSFGLTADSWDPHNHPLKFPSKLHVISWIITS